MINLKKKNEMPSLFSTHRFTVRRYTLDDESDLFEAARESTNEVSRFLPWCHADYCIEDSRSWLLTIDPNWNDQHAYGFAIFDNQTGNFLGGCGLNKIDEHPVANLGYWVRTSATGNGVATESTIGLARFGFLHLGLSRIEILMSTQNRASRTVAINSGAQFEGTLRNRLNLHGENHDALMYSLTPEDMKTNQ